MKNGTEVNRYGFERTSVSLDSLFQSTKPEDFIEKGLAQFLDKLGILQKTSYTPPKAAFKTLWGKEMPTDLAAMLELLGRADYPNLFGWETSALEVADLNETNIVKKALLDAEKRYLIFRQEFPGLEMKIPQYHIASYLGISPTQLSRVRNSLSKR